MWEKQCHLPLVIFIAFGGLIIICCYHYIWCNEVFTCEPTIDQRSIILVGLATDLCRDNPEATGTLSVFVSCGYILTTQHLMATMPHVGCALFPSED